jgi:hypothetical protein
MMRARLESARQLGMQIVRHVHVFAVRLVEVFDRINEGLFHDDLIAHKKLLSLGELVGELSAVLGMSMHDIVSM